MRSSRSAAAPPTSPPRGDARAAGRSRAAGRAGRAGRGRASPAQTPRVRVRMYRQGLGDCFLLTFGPDTGDAAHVLVDIGTIGTGGGVPLDEVVADLREATGGKLAVAIATHEHADHVSGFPLLAAAGITADEVWVAWTEDPSDPLARQLAKVRGDLFAAAQEAGIALEAAPRAGVLVPLHEGLRDLMRFNGFDPATDETLAAAGGGGGLKRRVDAMMRSALGLSARPPLYCSPGDVLEREWAPGVRFYVLGPPRDRAAIQQLGEHGSPDLYELVTRAKLPSAQGGPDGEVPDSWDPFDREYRVPEGGAAALGGVAAAYEAEPWRRIHEAILGAAADLALQLDNSTNNTSLVLAVEVAGEVLLFPGDAQLGSWRTWPGVEFVVRDARGERTVSGEELLRRTTFYKVGHHGSHNATSRPGLERMGAHGLTAFIPLDEGVARGRHWPMPARTLHERLVEKTRGRVLKSDRDAEAVRATGITVTRRYVEVTLPRRPPAPPG